MAIRIDGSRILSSAAEVLITQRDKTVLIDAYVWAGHQSSAAEGAIQKVRIVRPTIGEAVAELQRRWKKQSDMSSYVGFGGQFRHVYHLTADELASVMDDITEALEEVGLSAV